VNYKPEVMTAILQPYASKIGITIKYSHEQEPMGTAGPLALARELLVDEKDPDAPFFVLNSDITSEFPFQDLLQYHKAHGKEGTIMVTQVSEPSKYGVVVYDENSGRISRFVEKPQQYVGNKINAGIYIFNPSILKRIPLRPTSIEKEVFPSMANAGELYAMELKGFWMDIGQPRDYLAGLAKYLTSQQQHKSEALASGQGIVGPVLIHPTAKIGPDCVIGPFVSIGANAVVEAGARLKRCALFDGVRVQRNAWVDNSIIGWDSTVGRWVRMEGVSVLGRDVQISDELYVNGAMILDHKSIAESIPDPKIIM
jgi:mannose-1-phosphate guanylyltransferase